MLPASIFYAQARRIAELAAQHRLPSIFSTPEPVESGALMSYGQNPAEFYHRAATYLDNILKGAKPGEQPTKIDLVINNDARWNGSTGRGAVIAESDADRPDLAVSGFRRNANGRCCSLSERLHALRLDHSYRLGCAQEVDQRLRRVGIVPAGHNRRGKNDVVLEIAR